MEASAAASSPGAMTVSPGRLSASRMRGHLRAGDGDVRTDTARGRLAAQFLADGPRRAEQAPQSADVDRHQIAAVAFVARREFLCDCDHDIQRRTRRTRRGLFRRRWSIETRVHLPAPGRALARCAPPHRGQSNHDSRNRIPLPGLRFPASTLTTRDSRTRDAERLSCVSFSVSPAELRAMASTADQHARRLAAFDHALQPQPGRERQTPDGVGRSFADVEHDQAEVPGLQHERERADRLLERALVEIAARSGMHGDVPANPEQPGQVDRRPPPPTRRRACPRASTSAVSSPRAVAAASIRSTRLARPDDRAPTISDS